MTVVVLLLVIVVLVAAGSLLVLARIVPAGTVGVRMRSGSPVGLYSPGLHVVLPGERIVALPDGPQDVVLPRASYAARDGAVTIGATVTYRVVDPLRATSAVADVKAAIAELSAVAVRAWAEQSTVEQSRLHDSGAEETVRGVLGPSGEQWGYEVLAVEVRLG